MRFLSVVVLPLAAALPSYLGPRELLGSAPGAKAERQAKRKVDAAMAQFNFAPYELTHVGVQCAKREEDKSATGLYNCTLSFDWFDPNSVRQNNVTSTACSSSWLWEYVRDFVGFPPPPHPCAAIPRRPAGGFNGC